MSNSGVLITPWTRALPDTPTGPLQCTLPATALLCEAQMALALKDIRSLILPGVPRSFHGGLSKHLLSEDMHVGTERSLLENESSF